MKINIIKIIKISCGGCIAILIANVLELSNSTSAGVITLLSIQDTKKETLSIASKRIIAFCIALMISIFSFNTFGFNTLSFGLFLFVFIILCSVCMLQEGISTSAVLVTHFLVAKSMDFNLILNEFYLLCIGTIVGILINLYMPKKIQIIKEDQIKIDMMMKNIISILSEMLLESKTYRISDKFEELEKYTEQALTRAYENMNNYLLNDMRYYFEYVEMRINQCSILKGIGEHIRYIKFKNLYVLEISEFIKKVSIHFDEYNNAIILYDELLEIKASFAQSELPKTKAEFKSMAALYQIINELEYLLLIKKKFAQSLTKKQIEYFWT